MTSFMVESLSFLRAAATTPRAWYETIALSELIASCGQGNRIF